MNPKPPTTAWPPPSLPQLAATVVALAGRVSESDMRTQLYALAAVIENLGAENTDTDERRALEARLAVALASEDEPLALLELRRLTALDRAAVHPVDWSAASRG